jgi:hypothetical protein
VLQWKSNKYYIFWVWICSLRYPARNAHEPNCHLCPSRLYSTFPHYLINGAIFEKYSNIKFHANPLGGNPVLPCGWTDGRTDRQTDMTKLIVAFRNFVNALKRTAFPKLCNHTKTSGVAFGLPPSALYFRRACDLAFRSCQLLPYIDHCQWDLVSSSARRCCVQTVVAGIDLSWCHLRLEN